MPSDILGAAKLLNLPLNPASVVKTVQRLRELEAKEFPKILESLYPGWSYANELKTKYVVIYLIQEAMRKSLAGVPINPDTHLAECEAKADMLLAEHPYIDFAKLPEYDGAEVAYGGEKKKRSESLLKRVKEFCAGLDQGDRRAMVKAVIDRFQIDKGKANTYVHIYLKSAGVIQARETPKAERTSMLKRVKAFVSDNLGAERKDLIRRVMDEFSVDKAKAATYVSIALKETR
jgi:hypothetical protein